MAILCKWFSLSLQLLFLPLLDISVSRLLYTGQKFEQFMLKRMTKNLLGNNLENALVDRA